MASKDKKVSASSEETPAGALMRRPVLYALTLILLAFAIVAFIWVPSSGRGGPGNGPISFGSYDGKEIEWGRDAYITQAAEQIDRQVSAQFGSQESLDEQTLKWKNQYVWSQAFNQAVIRTAMLHESRSSGHLVSDKSINEQIIQLPGFQEDGIFSKEAWDSIGTVRRASIKKSIEEESLLDAYSSAMTSLHAPQGERDFLASMDAERRSFDMAAIPFSSWPDEEAKAYAAANSSLFRRMTLNFIRADSKKEDLQAVYDALISGAKTLEEAERESGTAYTVVEMASREYWEIKDLFAEEKDAESIFALASGAWSPILQDKDGQWVAYQCAVPAAAADLSKPDDLASVRSYAQDRERGILEKWANERAAAFAAEAASGFQAACRKFGIESKAVPAFPLNFGGNSLLGALDTEKVPELANARNDAAFFQGLFSLPEGGVSQPMVMGESVLVFRYTGSESPEEASASLSSGSYLSNYMDQAMYSAIMENKKLKNRFQETYDRYFAPAE